MFDSCSDDLIVLCHWDRLLGHHRLIVGIVSSFVCKVCLSLATIIKETCDKNSVHELKMDVVSLLILKQYSLLSAQHGLS